MKRIYGVCVGLLAMSLAVAVPSSTRAQNRSVAGQELAGAAAADSESASNSKSDMGAVPPHATMLTAALDDSSAVSPATAGDDPAPQGSSAPAATPAQAPAAAPAATPPALLAPSMSGPLAMGAPHVLSAGPLENIVVNGILSGIGSVQNNHVPGDTNNQLDVSNAQVFIQKNTGWFQFYLQGGIYNIPDLGLPYARAVDVTTKLYGPFPQGFVKLVKGNFNVEIGALPTLIGDEYTFDFENMNIERGLLWNQENAVNRGIQLNYTYKKATLAFSYNDGFYSNHYNWLTGSLAYAFNGSNTLTFVGGGNFTANGRGTYVTPLYQNNSDIFNVIYTYSHGNWIVSPYYQYSNVQKDASIGILGSAHTNGGALLLNYAFKHGFNLAIRPEYIKQSGNALDPNAITLLYGPGTGAFSFTVTPTYIKDAFFFRADVGVVHVTNLTTGSGFAFGPTGANLNQVRGMLEAGFMF